MDLDYIIKVSNRAKMVNLRFTAEDGLVVTIPKRYNKKKLHEVLARHENWINKMHLKFYKERKKRIEEPLLPNKINLLAVNEKWHIFYKQTNIQNVKIQQKENVIIIYGNITKHDLCLKALHEWLRKKARNVFEQLLEKHTKNMLIDYSGLRVANQKSRWGSCSSNKNISLSMKLLFLPNYIMNYVIIHELSHITHMNHSAKFWNYVCKFEPKYKKYDTELRKSWKYVPRFML